MKLVELVVVAWKIVEWVLMKSLVNQAGFPDLFGLLFELNWGNLLHLLVSLLIWLK